MMIAGAKPCYPIHHKLITIMVVISLNYQEIIRLGDKGRRVLAGEDSWTTLLQTFNKTHGLVSGRESLM